MLAGKANAILASKRLENLLETLSRPGPFILLCLIYFSVLSLLLCLYLPGGRSDEAESMLLTQEFRWGYIMRNPPLFDWLALGLMALLGHWLEIILVLKMASQFVMVIALYGIALMLQPDRRLAAIAALGSITTLHFHFYALTDLTHTLLSGAFFALGLLAFLRLGRDPSLRNQVLFGLVVGLGLLTKYTFLLFVLSLLVAGYGVPAYRRKIFRKELLIAVAVALVIVAPHTVWVIQEIRYLPHQMEVSLELDKYDSYWRGLFSGLSSLLVNTLSVLAAPLLLFAVAAFGRAPFRKAAGGSGDAWRLLRLILVLLLAWVTVVVILGAQHIEPHHLFFLTLFPLWFFGRLDAASLKARSIHLMLVLQLTWMLAVAATFAPRQIANANDCDSCGAYFPYQALAARLEEEGFERGTILYFNRHRRFNGSILKGYFPSSRLISPGEYMFRPTPHREANGQCLLIWDESSRDDLKQLIDSRTPSPDIGVPIPADLEVGTFEGRLLFTRDREYPVFYALFDGGLGTCR